MNELGVLSAFVPEFEPIVAMMQFNMYHSYTVDEHTIQVIANFAAIERGELEDELPLSSEILRKGLSRKVLLVAMLLHGNIGLEREREQQRLEDQGQADNRPAHGYVNAIRDLHQASPERVGVFPYALDAGATNGTKLQDILGTFQFVAAGNPDRSGEDVKSMAEWKATYQTDASPQQQADFKVSFAENVTGKD